MYTLTINCAQQQRFDLQKSSSLFDEQLNSPQVAKHLAHHNKEEDS